MHRFMDTIHANRMQQHNFLLKYAQSRPEPPTVTGLSLHIGFADKSSLYDYKKKDEFSHSIKRAISRIEKYHEIAIAHGDKCTGNIFALKNFDWKDKTETDITTKGDKLPNPVLVDNRVSQILENDEQESS